MAPRVRTLPPRLSSAPAPARVLATITPGSWRAPDAGSSERGYGYRWQKARAAYLDRHPLCVHCQELGQLTVATVVDHKIAHRGDWAIFWDSANWQALCKPCHDSWAQKRDNSAAR